MPTGEQIRAARALLDWGAPDLAKRVGVRRETILAIENNLTKPRAETIEKIARVFIESGIEFIGERGITRRDDQVVTLTGDNVFFRILDDVIASLKGRYGAEALFACVADALSSPLVIENYRRLRKAGIKMRSLIKEGDTELFGELDEYRCLPAKYFVNTPMVIYGDKIATMLYANPTLDGQILERKAIIVNNASLANAQRNLFDFSWSAASAPIKTEAKTRYDE